MTSHRSHDGPVNYGIKEPEGVYLDEETGIGVKGGPSRILVAVILVAAIILVVIFSILLNRAPTIVKPPIPVKQVRFSRSACSSLTEYSSPELAEIHNKRYLVRAMDILIDMDVGVDSKPIEHIFQDALCMGESTAQRLIDWTEVANIFPEHWVNNLKGDAKAFFEGSE